MMPGIRVSPPASTTRSAWRPTSPIAAIRPFSTATSARRGSWPSPSTIVAPRITRSYMPTFLPSAGADSLDPGLEPRPSVPWASAMQEPSLTTRGRRGVENPAPAG